MSFHGEELPCPDCGGVLRYDAAAGEFQHAQSYGTDDAAAG